MDANLDQIKGPLEQLPLEKSFRNYDTSKIVFLFIKAIKIIFSNYFLHETITCDNRNSS